MKLYLLTIFNPDFTVISGAERDKNMDMHIGIFDNKKRCKEEVRKLSDQNAWPKLVENKDYMIDYYELNHNLYLEK